MAGSGLFPSSLRSFAPTIARIHLIAVRYAQSAISRTAVQRPAPTARIKRPTSDAARHNSSALSHSARHGDIRIQYQLFHLAYARTLLICILDELTAIVRL